MPTVWKYIDSMLYAMIQIRGGFSRSRFSLVEQAYGARMSAHLQPGYVLGRKGSHDLLRIGGVHLTCLIARPKYVALTRDCCSWGSRRLPCNLFDQDSVFARRHSQTTAQEFLPTIPGLHATTGQIFNPDPMRNKDSLPDTCLNGCRAAPQALPLKADDFF